MTENRRVTTSIIHKNSRTGRPVLLLCLVWLLLTGAVLPGTAYAASSAKSHKITGAEFDDRTQTESKIYGMWDRPEVRTTCRVYLYKGTSLVGTSTVTGFRVNLSSLIASKKGGAGIYHFLVVPLSGGDSDMCTSDEIEITSETVTVLSKKINEDYKASKAGKGWEKGPGYIWIYYDAQGNQLKNQWLTLDGYKYWLDKNGFMAYGWTLINGYYYYLEPKHNTSMPFGACYTNTTTPDGYKVNEDGARIDQKSGTAKKAASYKTLSTLAVSLKEEQVPGQHTRITGISAGSGQVSNIVYSSDPSSWTTETGGNVDFDVTLNEEYVFTQNVKVTCSRASVVSFKKDGSTKAHVTLQYFPKYVLQPPQDFYITPELVIRWFRVPRAASYKVKVTLSSEDEEGKLKTSTVTAETTDTFFDLQPYRDSEEYKGIKSVAVSAVGADKKIFIDSTDGKVEDIEKLAEERTVNGWFSEDSTGLKYHMEDGEPATGWTQVLGCWYYFKKNGYAVTGWYQDQSGTWYYFDSKGRMQTGDVTIDGKEYRFNADADSSLPLGAWIQ